MKLKKKERKKEAKKERSQKRKKEAKKKERKKIAKKERKKEKSKERKKEKKKEAKSERKKERKKQKRQKERKKETKKERQKETKKEGQNETILWNRIRESDNQLKTKPTELELVTASHLRSPGLSHYSGWSKQFGILDGPDSSSDFHLFLTFLKTLRTILSVSVK